MSKGMTSVLDVQWVEGSLPNLPTLIGPFGDDHEALRWALLNCPDSTWQVRLLAGPYARPEMTIR